jgi:ribosomal protein S18 acetylase RimI-like enzyme
MQTLQDREAARLHDGLEDAFGSLFRAFVGRSLDPGLGFVLVERHVGLTREGRPPGMVTTADEFVPAVAPSGPRLEIDRVKDLEALEDARQVAVAGNGAGPLPAIHEPEVAAIPGVRIYVGRVEDRSVTTAMGWTANAATGIFQVATPPAHRRRGYGGAVTSRAVLDGFAAGADLAWLQPSRSAERLYRKLGFRQVGDVP